MMRISQDGIAVMHYFETCRLEAYPDPGSRDGTPWTIGWGHTGPEVRPGLVWTQAQADAEFLRDVFAVERKIQALVAVELSQGEFDALVCFAYNLGVEALRTSTLLRKLRSGDRAGASLQFRRWNKNDGQLMRGLTRRRAAEEGLFLGMSGAEAIVHGVRAA